MSELEQLNRVLNRILRELNALAVSTASSSFGARKAGLDEISQALVHLDALQRLICAEDPQLEYHYERDRPKTAAMAAIARFTDEAEDQIKRGDLVGAKETLRKALETEPPPLVYEVLEKRLNSLKE